MTNAMTSALAVMIKIGRGYRGPRATGKFAVTFRTAALIQGMPAAFRNLLLLRAGKRRQIRTVPGASDARELAHSAEKALLALEADAGAVGQRDHADFDMGVVGKSAEVAEHAGIGLRAA